MSDHTRATRPLRLVLVGEVRTAEFALRGLLRAGQAPCMVLTTDSARARASSGMAADYYCDLAGAARAHGIESRVIEDLDREADAIAALEPDYLLIMGWPYLVRERVLAIAPCIGMHPTPLPLRRGGAPLNWTLLDGEGSGAVSLLRLRAGVDDGEILAQRAFDIGPDDYVGDLLERVYAITEDLVAASVCALSDGSAAWSTQCEADATYTRRRRPEDGQIVWADSAVRIRNLVRATSRPFPGAFTIAGAETVRVWRAEVPKGYRAPIAAPPGTVLRADDGGVFVATRDNALLVTEAQLERGESVRDAALARAFAPLVSRVLA